MDATTGLKSSIRGGLGWGVWRALFLQVLGAQSRCFRLPSASAAPALPQSAEASGLSQQDSRPELSAPPPSPLPLKSQRAEVSSQDRRGGRCLLVILKILFTPPVGLPNPQSLSLSVSRRSLSRSIPCARNTGCASSTRVCCVRWSVPRCLFNRHETQDVHLRYACAELSLPVPVR